MELTWLINPFPNTSFWDRPKFKEVCRRQLKYGYLRILRYRLLRKHFGKDEIAQNEQFHLFPQCFPKAFLFDV